MRGSSLFLRLWTLTCPLALSSAATSDEAPQVETVASRFDTLKIIGDAIFVADQFRLGRFSTSGPFVVTNWTDNLTFRVGEVLMQEGGQSHDYWNVLAISNGMVEFHHTGFARRIGEFNEKV